MPLPSHLPGLGTGWMGWVHSRPGKLRAIRYCCTQLPQGGMWMTSVSGRSRQKTSRACSGSTARCRRPALYDSYRCALPSSGRKRKTVALSRFQNKNYEWGHNFFHTNVQQRPTSCRYSSGRRKNIEKRSQFTVIGGSLLERMPSLADEFVCFRDATSARATRTQTNTHTHTPKFPLPRGSPYARHGFFDGGEHFAEIRGEISVAPLVGYRHTKTNEIP